MRDSKFMRVVAALALAVAAIYVTTPLWAPAGSPAAPSAYACGGAAGSVISFVQQIQGQEKIYLLDTSTKVLLVYAASNGSASFNFVTGRSVEFDATFAQKLAARGQDLPFRAQGYDFVSVKNEAEKP